MVDANLKNFLNSLENCIFILNTDRYFLAVNPVFEKRLGFSLKELEGESVLKIYPENVHKKVNEKLSKKSDGAEISFLVPVKTKDGKEIPVETKINRINMNRQNLLFCVLGCVSKLHKDTDGLYRSEQIQNAVELSAEIFLKGGNLSGDIPKALEIIGKAAEISRINVYKNQSDWAGRQMVNKKYEWMSSEKYSGDFKKFIYSENGLEKWEETFNSGGLVYGNISEFAKRERKFLKKNNIVSFAAIPFIAKNRLWGVIRFDECEKERSWSGHEIDALKSAAVIIGAGIHRYIINDELIRTNSLLECLIDSIPEIIFFKNIDSIYLGCNKAFAEFTGREKDEIKGKTDMELFPENLAGFFISGDREVTSGSSLRGNEEWITYPDGRRVLIDLIKTPYYGPNYEIFGLLGVGRDITERKRVENELVQSRQKYYTLFEKANDYIILIDLKGIVIEMNERTETAIGYNREEIVGKHLTDLPILSEENRSFAHKMFSKRIKGVNIPSYELEFTHKDGHIIIGEISATAIKLQNDQVFDMLIIRDVTKRRELEKKVNRLRREHEAFMRHEFKNYMTPIILYSETLLMNKSSELDQKYLRLIRKIDNSAQRAARVIDNIKKLQDIENGNYDLNFRDFKLDTVVRKVISDNKILAEDSGVEIDFENNAENTVLPVDLSLMPGVFNNLIKNAIEHVEDSENGNEKTVKINIFNKNSRIYVEINNRGDVIPQEKITLFFEKFNTDRIKKAYGMGLGTTYALLVTKAHSGSINVSSDIKNGTTVTVIFPLKDSK